MIQHRFIFVGNLYVMPNFVYFLSRLMPSGIKGSEVDSSIFGAPIVYQEKPRTNLFLSISWLVLVPCQKDLLLLEPTQQDFFPKKIKKKQRSDTHRFEISVVSGGSIAHWSKKHDAFSTSRHLPCGLHGPVGRSYGGP